MGKNIYIGVDNVARKVKQPNIGVDGVARKVKNGFIGVDNVARQFFSGGTPISNLAVGTIVKLNENGVAQDYIIVNQGKPDGDIYDSSFNGGTWLLRKDTVEQVLYANTTGVSYCDSNLRTWLNSTMLGRYDAVIQNVIKTVNIPHAKINTSDVLYGSNGLSDKIFVLTVRELGYVGNAHNLINPFGTRLAYFNEWSGDPADASTYTTSGTGYVTRSQGYYYNTYCSIYQPPYITFGSSDTNTQRWVRPALIMPFETLVGDNMNIIAS